MKEINKDFYNDLPSMVCEILDDSIIPKYRNEEWFARAWEEYRQHKDHDTRLINFVLDTVMEEIGKLYEPYEGEEQIMIEHHILDKVSTIINNLKVK